MSISKARFFFCLIQFLVHHTKRDLMNRRANENRSRLISSGHFPLNSLLPPHSHPLLSSLLYVNADNEKLKKTPFLVILNQCMLSFAWQQCWRKYLTLLLQHAKTNQQETVGFKTCIIWDYLSAKSYLQRPGSGFFILDSSNCHGLHLHQVGILCIVVILLINYSTSTLSEFSV